MAASYNRVVLLGNLGRDPEVKYLQSGTAVCNVGLAVTDKYKDKSGEWQESTTWIDIVFWARTAEILAEHCGKGSSILVEGRLKMSEWQQDGAKRTKLEVVCEKMQMVGSKKGGGSRPPQATGGTSAAPAAPPSLPDEESPF